MHRRTTLHMAAVLAVGAALGYAAAAGRLRFGSSVGAASEASRPAPAATSVPVAPCCELSNREQLLARATAQEGKKPNILVIFGDDIGITNVSAYSDGLMGYETPNIDRIAKEGL